VSDSFSLAGSSKLAQLLGGYLPPRKKFSLDVVRADASGKPVTITLHIAARAISIEETEEAHADAVKYLTGKGAHTREDFLTSTGDAIMEAELMVQVLARALMDPDDPRTPWARDAAHLRGTLFTDEIDACFRHYSAFQAERSPIRALRSGDELKEVVEALGKGQIERTALLRYDAISLSDIALSLADRVQTLTRPNSSATSPQTDSPEASSDPSLTQPPITVSLESVTP
jgi:hypothetical protein